MRLSNSKLNGFTIQNTDIDSYYSVDLPAIVQDSNITPQTVGNTGVYTDLCNNFTIDNCSTYDGDYGFYAVCLTNFTVSNSYFDSSSTYALFTESSSNFTVVNSEIDDGSCGLYAETSNNFTIQSLYLENNYEGVYADSSPQLHYPRQFILPKSKLHKLGKLRYLQHHHISSKPE